MFPRVFLFFWFIFCILLMNFSINSFFRLLQEIDLCHYGGVVRDKPGSWVAVSTCHGIQGIVFDGERMRYIEPAQGNHIFLLLLIPSYWKLKTIYLFRNPNFVFCNKVGVYILGVLNCLVISCTHFYRHLKQKDGWMFMLLFLLKLCLPVKMLSYLSKKYWVIDFAEINHHREAIDAARLFPNILR